MLLKRTRETIYNNRFTILKNHTRSITNYPPFTNSSSSTSFPFSKRGKGIAKKFLRSLRHKSFLPLFHQKYFSLPFRDDVEKDGDPDVRDRDLEIETE